ncbi:carbohydrate binding domain-containing protein, partial [bacterium]|nr:carbohydrate binding domain-containing protein [bacterium]
LSWQTDYIFGDHPDGIGVYYSEELDGLFNQWLSEKYPDDAALASAWLGGGEAGGEIIRNGSFESGLGYWDTYIHTAGGAAGTIQVLSTEAHDGAKSARITVTQAGTAGWHAQIKPKPLSVQRGKDYRLVFFIKADAVHPFEIELLENQTWEWYGSYSFASSTDWKQGELYFTPPKDFTDSFVIQFDFGTTEGVYWLDGVSLVQAAGQGLEEGESLAQGNVRRTRRSEIGKHSAARVGDNAGFYFDVEGRYIESLAGYMKQELGVKCPVTFTNNYYGLVSIYSQSRADYMDAHFYWDHPSMPNGWSDTDWTMHNRSMLRDPYNSTFNHMPLCRVKNKPLVISEYNHPYPTAYQSEMPALFFAYGGFFDLDGLLYHAYYDYMTNYPQQWQDLFFDIAMNPIVMTQFILSVPYRQGRVQPALNRVVADYRDVDVFNNTKIYQDAALLNLSESGVTTYFLSDGFAHGNFNAGQTVLSGPVADPGQVISSSTGELQWDGILGIFTINNPYWQGTAGFLKNRVIDLGSIRIDQVHTTDGEDFAAIHLVAMDGLPLASSRSMVLVTTARLENRGLIWNPEKTSLVNPGGEIALCEPVYGSLEFRNASLDSFAVFPLDERGMRRNPLAVTFAGDNARFSLGEKTLWYEIVNAGSGGSSVNTGLEAPERFVLHQNYPNPFNSRTTVEFMPDRTDELIFSILDTNGRCIMYKKIHARRGEKVQERIDLDGSASGIYIVSIESQTGMRAGMKMVMMK